MATKRLIDLDVAIEKAKASDKIVGSSIWETGEVVEFLEDCPIEDAVPVDEFRLHHVLIDNEGVPEVKLQFGDRYVILRTDPVDVRQVVHGRWEVHEHPYIKPRQDGWICTNCSFVTEDIANGDTNYCPNRGAKMDGDGNA